MNREQCRIRVSRPQVSREGAAVKVSADYLLEDGEGASLLLHQASFRFAWDGEFRLPGAEAFVTVGLIPAMKLGVPVVCDGGLAPGFTAGLERLQDVAAAWFPGLKRVPVCAPERVLELDAGRGVACFFSGGVDSFQAIHRHREEITRLVYIEGFDIDLHQASHRLYARRRMAEAAADLGLPLTVVETDARHFLDRYAWWGHTGGTVAGAVAQLFSAHHRKTIMGCSNNWAWPKGSGDGSLLLQQFGLRDQKFEVAGLTFADRPQKLAAMGAWPPLMRHLRVCWEMPEGRLNCGVCEKCLRTMASLQSCGLLGQCRTLPDALDWERVEQLNLTSDLQYNTWEYITQMPVHDPATRAHLDALMHSLHVRRAAASLWSAGKDLAAAQGWPVLARKLGKPLFATVAETDPGWLRKKAKQQLPELRGLLWEAIRRKKPSLVRILFGRKSKPGKEKRTS